MEGKGEKRQHLLFIAGEGDWRFGIGKARESKGEGEVGRGLVNGSESSEGERSVSGWNEIRQIYGRVRGLIKRWVSSLS